MLLDGRFVGLVQMDLRTLSVARAPTSFGLLNISTGVCATTDLPPVCDDAKLITDGVPGAFLWADGTHLAPGGQIQLAELAIQRAQRNPF